MDPLWAFCVMTFWDLARTENVPLYIFIRASTSRVQWQGQFRNDSISCNVWSVVRRACGTNRTFAGFIYPGLSVGIIACPRADALALSCQSTIEFRRLTCGMPVNAVAPFYSKANPGSCAVACRYMLP